MAVVSENKGAWILSPYCICADRPWLSINDVWGKDVDDKVNVGGGITPIFGLSTEDSALLAALLTALAIFLFLLFLLLCLLCPCGLCCGKLCPCCFKAKKSGKTASQKASVVGGKNVNLTAVGMRIPRVWTDGDTGFSETDLGKRQRIWEETKDGRQVNFGGQKDEGVRTSNLELNGWISGRDLGGQQGEGYQRSTKMKEWNKGNKERNSEMVALNEFYHNSPKMVPPTLRHRSNSYSSIIEKLMTPRSTSHLTTGHNRGVMQGHDSAGRATVNHSSYDYFARDSQYGDQALVTVDTEAAPKMNDALHSTAKRDFTNSAVNLKTEDSVHNISSQAESTRTSGYDNAANSRIEPYVVNSVATVSSATSNNNSNFLRDTGITRETCNPGYNLIMETSSYMKRVVEETETVTTG